MIAVAGSPSQAKPNGAANDSSNAREQGHTSRYLVFCKCREGGPQKIRRHAVKHKRVSIQMSVGAGS
jgi:hypothetical protein